MSEDAVIGIIGTLLGTIIGWGLNLLSNSSGKLDISIVRCACHFYDIKKNKIIPFYENPYSGFIDMQIRVTNFKNHMIGLNNYQIQVEYEEKREKIIDIFQDEDGKIGDNLEELTNLPAYYSKTIYFAHNWIFIPESEKLKNGFRIVMTYHINGKKKEYNKILYEQNPKQ